MKKYRLIKEYPGSPTVGTILAPKVDKELTNTNNFYWGGSWFNPNDFSEFWEEIIEYSYLVYLKEQAFHSAWHPFETKIWYEDTDYKKYFTSKDEAEEYILLNKPDISLKYLEDYYGFKMVELRKKIKDERAQDK